MTELIAHLSSFFTEEGDTIVEATIGANLIAVSIIPDKKNCTDPKHGEPGRCPTCLSATK